MFYAVVPSVTEKTGEGEPSLSGSTHSLHRTVKPYGIGNMLILEAQSNQYDDVKRVHI